MTTIERFRRAYLEKERGLSPRTGRTYEWACLRMEELTGKAIEEVSTLDCRRYLQESDDPPATKRTMLAANKSYHRFYCLETDTAPDARLALQAPKNPPQPKDSITRDQAYVLLSISTDPVTARLVFFGLYAGLRIGEMTAAKWEDNRLSIGSKGRVREIPTHPHLERVKDVLSEASPTVGQLAYRATLLKDRTGIDFAPHDLRRRFSRCLEEAEQDWKVVESLMGHAQDTTMIYTGGISWGRKVAAVAKLDYLRGRVAPLVASQMAFF